MNLPIINEQKMTNTSDDSLPLAEREELEKVKNSVEEGLKDFKERDYNWLWHYLIQQSNSRNYRLRRDNKDQESKIENLIRNILHKNITIENILRAHSTELLNINLFEWINQSDYRQLIFIINSAILYESNIINYKFNLDDNLFDQILNYFDIKCSEQSKKIKTERLNKIKSSWMENTIPKKYSAWLNPDDKNQLEWTFNYLSKKGKIINVFELHPYNNERHFHSLILATLDTMKWKDKEAENQLFMGKMKQAWSLKKFRDAGKDKKPYHIPLTITAKRQLDILTEFHNAKSYTVLEMLIKREYESKILTEEGKPKFRKN